LHRHRRPAIWTLPNAASIAASPIAAIQCRSHWRSPSGATPSGSCAIRAGYHEISDAGGGFLGHEVLFSSGATVLLEFRDLSVERVERPAPDHW
jgi:hypothetical protein